jgi:hypothetical protein
MILRRSGRALAVVPVYAAEADAPTLAQVQAAALPALTRLFVVVLSQRLQKESPERT